MKKLSIIIPCYNSEKYIKTLLDTIILEINNSDEVIIVNDGSTDDSEKVIKKYTSINKNIKYFSTKNNGVSHARNIGINKAKNDYILFADADDFFIKDSIKRIKEQINKTDKDVYMFNTIKYIEKKDKYIMETPIFKSDTVSPNELSKNKIFSRVWRFVCKRDFIISNNCYFIENHTYEDEEWVPKIISQVDNVEYISDAFYVYRKHDNSITSKKDFTDIKGIINIINNVYTNKSIKKNKLYVYNSLLRCVRTTFSYLKKATPEETKYIMEWYKKNKPMIYKITNTKKIYTYLIKFFGPKNATKLYKKFFAIKYDLIYEDIRLKKVKGGFTIQ